MIERIKLRVFSTGSDSRQQSPQPLSLFSLICFLAASLTNHMTSFSLLKVQCVTSHPEPAGELRWHVHPNMDTFKVLNKFFTSFPTLPSPTQPNPNPPPSHSKLRLHISRSHVAAEGKTKNNSKQSQSRQRDATPGNQTQKQQRHNK